jgi:hypothetical protein
VIFYPPSSFGVPSSNNAARVIVIPRSRSSSNPAVTVLPSESHVARLMDESRVKKDTLSSSRFTCVNMRSYADITSSLKRISTISGIGVNDLIMYVFCFLHLTEK